MRFPAFLLLGISFVFSLNLQANLQVDSLLLELKSTSQNKEKTLILNRLSRSFMETNLDSAIYYAKQGYEQASNIRYRFGIAENSASLGDFYISYDSLLKARQYYLIAGEQFEELELSFDLAQIYMIVGNIYLSQSYYSDALEYYQKCEQLSIDNNLDNLLPHIFNNKGIIYSSLDELDKALDYYMKAYNGFKEYNLNSQTAHVVSNIASIHLKNNREELALEYYEEALNMFIDQGNYIDAIFVYTDLGDYEFERNSFDKALEYFKKGYDQIELQDIGYEGPKSRALVLLTAKLGAVNRKLGNFKQAIINLEEALNLAYQNDYVNWIEFSSYQLSLIYEEKGDFTKALSYFKTYEQFGDSILNESSIKRITQLEMQFQFDKEIKEREFENVLKEAQQQKKEFLYLLFIGLGLFSIVILILMYFNQRNKISKIELKRQNLKLEHEKLQQELEHRNKELTTNVMYLLSKNEFITSTAEKLTKAKMGFKKENQKIIQDVIRDLLQNSSKDVWREFEVRFQEVHSEFYDNLNEKYPDLTPNEKKICAFLRLNMSTKDICAITYQSVRSIDMARFRLRKKIGLDSDENLVSFLSQF